MHNRGKLKKMTTIIGIKGLEPEINEPYIILFSDTQGNYTKTSVNNEQKLFSPDKGNYAIGTAGKILTNFFSEKNQKKEHDLINKGLTLNRENLEDKLKQTNQTIQDDVEQTNEYIIALQEQDTVNLYSYIDKLRPVKTSAAAGTGIHDLDLSELKKYETNGQILADKQDIIKIGVRTLQEVAKKDYHTGGNISIAVVKPNFKTYLKNYANTK